MSLQVWLPLTENLDNQGLSDLKFSILDSSNISKVGNAGKLSNSCYKSNAKNKATIISNKTIDLGTQQSMFCWVKPDSFNSDANLSGVGGQHRYYDAAPSNMGITLKYLSATTGRVCVNTAIGTTRTYSSYYGNTTINAGEWHHIGYTYDGTTVTLYLDGQVDGTFNLPGMNTKADYIHLFSWSLSGQNNQAVYSTNYNLIGAIQDFRIYDHCLSTKEIKDISKGLCIYYPCTSDDATELDCSGFNHHGTKIGENSLETDSPRNNVSLKLNSSNSGTNTSTGASYLQSINGGLYQPERLTIAFWLKPIAWDFQRSGILSLSENDIPLDYQTSTLNQYDYIFRFNDSNKTVLSVSATSLLTNNEWHHYAFVFDGSKIKAYKDGELFATSQASSSTGKLGSFNSAFLGLSLAGTVWRQSITQWSDFRIYATALAPEDIKELYSVSAQIDNIGNLYGYEFIEDDSISISKTGIIDTTALKENHIFRETDGSLWYHVAHHSNPAGVLFTKSNININGTFEAPERWVDLTICNRLDSWEFLWIEQQTTTSTPLKYRWIQYKNPYTATYADVAPGKITGVYTSGYSNSGHDGGIYRHNTYSEFIVANTWQSNWFGAIGCWTHWGVGIPGHYPNGIGNGKFDLYVRIDTPKTRFAKTGLIDANNFYEI